MTPYSYKQTAQSVPLSIQNECLCVGTRRQQVMSALALADLPVLETAVKNLPQSLSYTFLRQPEAGLVMLEGRAGNTGQRFNLGEMLVTRCVIRLDAHNGNPPAEGYAFVQGNKPRHAELAAFFDALMQLPDWSAKLHRALIAPILAMRQEKLAALQKETAATKVDFFTMVRGEDE